MSEAESTITRIKNHPNVGFLITDKNQKLIRTNYIGEEKAKEVK